MFLAATPTTAAARVNQVSVEFQLFFYHSFLSCLSFALHIPLSLSLCRWLSPVIFAACHTVQAVCIETLQLPSTESTHKRDIKRARERERRREGGLFIPLPLRLACSFVCFLCASYSLCVSSAPFRFY